MTDGTTQSAAVVGLSFTTRQNQTPSFTSPVLYYACPAYAHHRWALREPATSPRPSVRLSHASSSKKWEMLCRKSSKPLVISAAAYGRTATRSVRNRQTYRSASTRAMYWCLVGLPHEVTIFGLPAPCIFPMQRTGLRQNTRYITYNLWRFIIYSLLWIHQWQSV